MTFIPLSDNSVDNIKKNVVFPAPPLGLENMIADMFNRSILDLKAGGYLFSHISLSCFYRV